jgi:putative ABC transport system permease protein
MIGVALITFVSIFAAGIRASVNDVVDRSFAGDLTVRNQDGFSPLPRGTAAGIERGLGSDVQSVTGVRFASSLVRGVKGTTVTVGVDPASMATGYKVKWDQGNDALLRGLQPDQVIVDKNWADGKHVDVGETLQVTTAKGEHVPLKVVGTLDEGGTSLIGGGILVSNAALARDWDLRNDAFVFLNWRPGVDPVAARRKLDALLARQFPIAESQNRQEVKDAQAGQVNQILGLFYALLGLSIIVSLFGIVNTLALSIFERTRELGMLRAIGTSRRQVRRTVRYESAITAMIGAVLGIVLGTVFAFAVTQPLADEGFAFSLPVGTLAGLLVLAALAGVLAAIGPARRASRIDVLRALAYE